MSLQPVILSGGSGTRLWPLSREAYPKQFLPLTSEHTCCRRRRVRLDGLADEHPRQALHVLDPIVVCNEAHRFLVAEQFRPRARGRVHHPGAGRAQHRAGADAGGAGGAKGGADPVLLVMPADHTIADARAFAVPSCRRLSARRAGCGHHLRHRAEQARDRLWLHPPGRALRRHAGLRARPIGCTPSSRKPDLETAKATSPPVSTCGTAASSCCAPRSG
jgi:hypothetical protein